MSADRDAVRDQLAAALRVSMGGLMWGRLNARELAGDLLPAVEVLANQRAAAELEAVRRWLLETGRADADTLWQIRDRTDQIDRAAALRASNGQGTS